MSGSGTLEVVMQMDEDGLVDNSCECEETQFQTEADIKQEEEQEAEDVEEFSTSHSWEFPAAQTPEPIGWEGQVQMMQVRRQVNDMTNKVEAASHKVDTAREELKKCRAHLHHLESERDSLFGEIEEEEAAGNNASIYRLRAAHQRACRELEEEEKLETKIQERLEQAEYDLAVVEVQQGKFLLAEDDLLTKEEQLSNQKIQAAHQRFDRQQYVTNTAIRAKLSQYRKEAQDLEKEQLRHQQLMEESTGSQEIANRYLSETMLKLRQRHKEAQEANRKELERRMEMLIKLKADIAQNKENMRVIRARQNQRTSKQREKEQSEYNRIVQEGGNADQVMLINKRKAQQEQERQNIKLREQQGRVAIIKKLLTEERRMKTRIKQQPHLFPTAKRHKELTIPKHEPPPPQVLLDYIQTTTEGNIVAPPPQRKFVSFTSDKAAEDLQPEEVSEEEAIEEERAEEEQLAGEEQLGEEEQLAGEEQGRSQAKIEARSEVKVGKKSEEKMEAVAPAPASEKTEDSSEDSQEDISEGEVEDLARPDFEGLWDREADSQAHKRSDWIALAKPLGGSTMEKEILKERMEIQRQAIVKKQIVAGRLFTGRAFYSKPDVIHFKNYKVGSTYKKRVQLTNVSYSINCCKFLEMSEILKDFITVDFNPPGQLSAGMTCDFLVTFKPMINEDLSGELQFLSHTGAFGIPLRCSTKKCHVSVDTDTIDFGTVVVGESRKKSVTLTNSGALGTTFTLLKIPKGKPQTASTISLGRLTSDSPSETPKTGSKEVKSSSTGTDKTDRALSSKKLSEEEEAKEEQRTETGAVTEITIDATEVTTCSDMKVEEELGEEGLSPDPAVSELEDDSQLDGMRVGAVATGKIAPKSSQRLEIVWQPTIPGRAEAEFRLTFADPLSPALTIQSVGFAIDAPVWLDKQTMDLKICMFDRLYQDTIVVNNRASTALGLKFEVAKEMSNHMEVLPKTGFIQGHSQFSAQLKFLPRTSLFEDASKYFDCDTGVLEVPMTIRVADQTAPVTFMVNAVVTTSDLEFDVPNIDFGHCTVCESVRCGVKLTNKSILPQKFGFMNLPDYLEVQPNDGFGTLLPLETIDLDIIFSPNKAWDYKFPLACKTVINRDFVVPCVGVGVLPPLKLSHQVINFAGTALYDVSTACVHVVNSHCSGNEFTHPVPRIGAKGENCPVGPTSFEFVVPEGVPLTLCPAVGTVLPGEKARIQLRFSPRLEDQDVRKEAVRVATKLDQARAEKEYEEALQHQRELIEQAQKASAAKGRRSAKPGKGAPQVTLAPSSTIHVREVVAPDPSSILPESPEYISALASMVRRFRGSFRTINIPCYVTSGKTKGPGELPYSIHNTLYLEVHCPMVRPELVVISNQGSNVINFGDVSIGQRLVLPVTIQNISSKALQLHSSALDTGGPFLVLNAFRALAPNGTHNMLVSFIPKTSHLFHENLKVTTANSTLHLTFQGHGVRPVVDLGVEDGLLDMGAVLVNEFCEKVFKIENTSPLAIEYRILQDSLSPDRHEKAQVLPQYVKSSNGHKNYVGTQNFNGRNVFDLVPSEGTIEAGESKEITATFAPDHESLHYSDGIHIELFHQEESHFFQVKGQCQPHLMYIEGTDTMYPDVESLGVTPSPPEPEEELKAPAPQRLLLSLHSHAKEQAFVPATAEIQIAFLRPMSMSLGQKKETKKSGEFLFENFQPLVQKGFTIDPVKGSVEAGSKKPVTITWTPVPGTEMNTIEHVTVTLKSDISVTYDLMLSTIVQSA